MISRTVNPQYENYLAVKKGALQSQRLAYDGQLNASATGVRKGSLVSLDANGKFVLGLPEGTGYVYPMPMFSKKNAYDPDVATGATTASGDIVYSSVVGGTITAYVATGAFELETSEYDNSKTYSFNQALVGAVDGSQEQTGKVTPATTYIYGAKTVVGIVSALPFRSKASANVNGTGNNRLCFWPVFFPPTRS